MFQVPLAPERPYITQELIITREKDLEGEGLASRLHKMFLVNGLSEKQPHLHVSVLKSLTCCLYLSMATCKLLLVSEASNARKTQVLVGEFGCTLLHI